MNRYIVMLSICFIAAAHTVNAQLKEFSWLLGTWKMKDKNVFESWSVAKDGKTLEGTSYRLKDADTVVMEEIRFTFESGSFHYIPDIAGDQGAVDFKITEYSTSGFVAENPAHDFPKLIRYKFIRKENSDSIEASIEGDGKVIGYGFSRVR
jgi:hypothetical protein